MSFGNSIRQFSMARLLSCAMLVFVFLSGVQEAIAQKRIPRHVDFGLLGGANFSAYDFSPAAVSQDKALGYTAGVGIRYIEEEIFGLQAEMHLTRRGIKDRYDKYPECSFQRNLTYVEVPVMAHVYFECGKKNEISFDIGPKIGFFINDDVQSHLPDDFDQRIGAFTRHGYAHHTLDVTQKFDYGIQAGLGYEFKCAQATSIQLQGRYYFGLGNIFPDEKSDVFQNSRNSSIQVVASFWWKHWVHSHRRKTSNHDK